jgi:hypothetical protein
MGVKFNREYKEISEELTEAIGAIEDCYEFMEMEREDWLSMDRGERHECVRTLSDDIFYALGTERSVSVGSGTVEYDAANHRIKVCVSPQLTHVIMLI